MCLLALAWRSDPRWPLVLIGNRDERHDRLSAAAARWPEAPQVLAGRDLEFGGAWLGVSELGRLAAVTNIRNPAEAAGVRVSRGLLTSRFLGGEIGRSDLEGEGLAAYNPCNFLVIDAGGAALMTNRPREARRPAPPGLHGLSNGTLEASWPKTRRAVAALESWLAAGEAEVEPLFEVLADETPAPDEALPDTGVGLERERLLSPCFLRGPVYGTRCSTVVRIDAQGRGELIERRFGPDGRADGETALAFRWPI